MINPVLPLPEGDRIVSLMNWDASTNNRELRDAARLRRVARDDVARRISASAAPSSAT